MASTINTMNVAPLAFFTAEKWQNHRRAFVYGNILPLVAPLGVVPVFVLARDLSDNDSFGYTLVNFNTQEETVISSKLIDTGLTGFTTATKNVTQYPGTVALPSLTFEENYYYIRAEDGNGNIIYSEIFAWQEDLDNNSKYIRVEWWHGEDFEFPQGTIRYDFPFKMWCYLYTDIGKPERQKKEEVEERDGRKLPLKQISWKVFKFEFRAPEYFLDALDLIWQHDACEITHMGRVYEVEEFVMNTEWLEYGDFARVTVEFRTDTVVVINGRALTDFDYEVDACGCFTANYDAVAWIEEGTIQYTGFYWTDEFGQDHSFASGDYIVVQSSIGINTLMQFNGAIYISTPIAARETVCTEYDSRATPYERDSFYFFRDTATSSMHQAPIINSESNVGDVYTISGDTFENTIIEVWGRDDDGDHLIGTYTDDDFFSGIEFDASGYNAYWVRARTYVCDNLGESEYTALEGIGFDVIGTAEVR